MRRRGIDSSGKRSKHLSQYLEQPFDYVITVCDQAAEICPIFRVRAQRIHWSFPDPAAVQGSAAEILAAFERGFEPIKNDASRVFRKRLIP
jgi:arsenate reductase